MPDKCVMVVQDYDNIVSRKGYEDFASMKHEAYHNQADRVLYWWCEIEELEVRLHASPEALRRSLLGAWSVSEE